MGIFIKIGAFDDFSTISNNMFYLSRSIKCHRILGLILILSLPVIIISGLIKVVMN